MPLFRRSKGPFAHEIDRFYPADPKETWQPWVATPQDAAAAATGRPYWFTRRRLQAVPTEIRLPGSYLPATEQPGQGLSSRGWFRRRKAEASPQVPTGAGIVRTPPADLHGASAKRNPPDVVKTVVLPDKPTGMMGRRDIASGSAKPAGRVSATAPDGSGRSMGARAANAGQTRPRQSDARKKPVGSSEAAKEGTRRSDLTIAALGITLGLICALFPWYIFFNPEKFGPPAVKFEGGGPIATGPVATGPQPQRVGAPMNIEDVPVMQLDLFATGTVSSRGGDGDGGPNPPGVDEQPFPAEIPQFKLVHVANGRAMIEDNAGLWIVQRGSTLPDSTEVTSIEQRGGKWVMVTSADRVIELTP